MKRLLKLTCLIHFVHLINCTRKSSNRNVNISLSNIQGLLFLWQTASANYIIKMQASNCLRFNIYLLITLFKLKLWQVANRHCKQVQRQGEMCLHNFTNERSECLPKHDVNGVNAQVQRQGEMCLHNFTNERSECLPKHDVNGVNAQVQRQGD